jgi:RNA polymerase sigma-70 factor, ECF subfamily
LPDDLEERGTVAAGGSGLVASGSHDTDDPAERVTRDERRDAVLSALGTLPAEQRAALVLVDMEGYSIEETAAILDCAPGTVKSRCSRGRARLLPLVAHLAPGRRDSDLDAGAGNLAAGTRVPPPAEEPPAAGPHQPSPGQRPPGPPPGSTHTPPEEVSNP